VKFVLWFLCFLSLTFVFICAFDVTYVDESLKWPHSFIAVQNNICTLCIVFILVANTVTHD